MNANAQNHNRYSFYPNTSDGYTDWVTGVTTADMVAHAWNSTPDGGIMSYFYTNGQLDFSYAGMAISGVEVTGSWDNSRWHTSSVRYPDGWGGVASGGGGEPLSSWLCWTNNSVNTVSYGATVVGGSTGVLSSGAIRYYSNAWKGNQYIKTFNLTKVGTGIGYGTSVFGFFIGGYNFVVSDRSWGDYGALGISLLSSGLTLSGVTSPIGITIGFIDVAGGFNGFYQGLDANQHLYKTTGGVIFPINGIPTYIQLKK